VGVPCDHGINSEEESADNDDGRAASPVGEIHTFNDPEPKPEPKKRKSQLEQLGIPKPEKRELTEDEQRKADELATEFSSFLRPQKSDDFWKGLDFGSAFEGKGEISDRKKLRYWPLLLLSF